MPYDGPVDESFKVTRKKEKKEKKDKETAHSLAQSQLSCAYISYIRSCHTAEPLKKMVTTPWRHGFPDFWIPQVMPYPRMYYGMQTAFMDPHAAERQMQEYARLQQEGAKRRPELAR